MSNPVLDTIRDRRSIRAYTDKPLTEAELATILTAAQQSPSARNTQPWHFTVVEDQNLIREMEAHKTKLICAELPEGKRGRFDESGFRVFYGAPTVIFISTPINPPSNFSKIDCGIAVQNMALAAHSLGLGSVIVGMIQDIFNTDKGDYYRTALKFPAGFDFAIAISIGTAAMTKPEHPIHDGMISYVR